jgi:hypothetical protein
MPKLLFTVRHTTKPVHCCMSQYSSTHHIITNVKHLLKWRDIKHTDQPRTNKSLNYLVAANLLKRNTEYLSNNYSCVKCIKQYLLWVCACSLNYRASNAQTQQHYFVSVPTTLLHLTQQAHNFQKDVHEHKISVLIFYENLRY